jgi:uracil-DNA glycosylase
VRDSPTRKIMLVGQNPGSKEAELGRPFVGRAGNYLNSVLKKYGLERSQLYITSVVKETTPHNRIPNSEEIKRWMPLLMEEIKLIRPKIVVLMGKVAWQTPRFKGIEFIETYHPAAAMRFPKIRQKFENDFEKLEDKTVN